MKTSKILKSKTCVSLTKNEMLKILGGENGAIQSSTVNTTTNNSMQQENQKFSTLSNVIKTK